MKNKMDRQTEREQIDRLLEKQYNMETGILETALLKAAGKTSWEEFPDEPEEKVHREYDRLITRLKAKGEYRDSEPDMDSKRICMETIREVKEWRDKSENSWERTHRFLEPVAAIVAAVMLTALTGMTVIADFQISEKNAQGYGAHSGEKK